MTQTTHVLDSNVYGELMVDPAGAKIIRNVKEDKSLLKFAQGSIPRTLVRKFQFQNSPICEERKTPPFRAGIAPSRRVLLYVYGLDIIREELMAVPATVVDKGEQIRKTVLSVYRAVVDEEISLPPLAAYLASQYFEEFYRLRELNRYKRVVGTRALSKLRRFTEDDLRIDFQIIATASLVGADVVVSMDTRTILSPVAADAYGGVNARNRLRTPTLVKYSDFRTKYLVRWSQ